MAEPERITRRDFLNGTLLASGAALVSAACPFQLMAAEDWNGTAGIGDYAGANGNTHQVMVDGHTIRDHAFDPGATKIGATRAGTAPSACRIAVSRRNGRVNPRSMRSSA